MTLGEFTKPGLILPHLAGRDAASVIQELSQTMHAQKLLPDSLPFYQAALNREFLVSTEMEQGVAFPHARLANLPDLFFALGRSHEPLSWGPSSAHRVNLIFLIAIPATDATQYLALISALVRLCKDPFLLSQLQAGSDSQSMFDVLNRVDVRTNPINIRRTATI
jgi:mannitol/fructose-specific phosphotransferase system IIA component (Ntr-type)